MDLNLWIKKAYQNLDVPMLYLVDVESCQIHCRDWKFHGHINLPPDDSSLKLGTKNVREAFNSQEEGGYSFLSL